MLVDMFYTVMLQLINYHFPIIESKQMSNDMPWVTDRFRQLIRAWQSAYRSGNVPVYNKYRNKVQRLAKQLQKQYYECKVQDLRTSNPRKWWSSVKKFLGSNRNIDLRHLCLHENIEDLDLAGEINNFLLMSRQTSSHCNQYRNLTWTMITHPIMWFRRRKWKGG